MAYLGTPPQSGFITTAKQRVTSSTNNYVDLDHAISSIADVIVFVNFVKQDTTNLSLTTSTRITLGGTLVSSDIVEIHYLGKAVNTQTPGTATVTNNMLAGSIAQAKLSDEVINEAKLQVSNAPTNGYMLTAQSGNTGGLTWAEAPSGALSLISATAVTDGVSAFNINSVFSSSYQMYMMIVQNIRITADANVRLRFGASGTFNSTSSYRYVGTMTDRSGTDRTYHDGSDTSMRIVANLDGNDGLSHAFGVYYIANPNVAATNSNRKRVTGHYNVANESGNSVLTTCNFAGELEVSTTAFDGIRLLVDSGNFRGGTANDGDGMIKIYGIADS